MTTAYSNQSKASRIVDRLQACLEIISEIDPEGECEELTTLTETITSAIDETYDAVTALATN